MADLINTIKMSKVPIICICNDKYVQKLRSLRNHVSHPYCAETAQLLVRSLNSVICSMTCTDCSNWQVAACLSGLGDACGWQTIFHGLRANR